MPCKVWRDIFCWLLPESGLRCPLDDEADGIQYGIYIVTSCSYVVAGAEDG